MSQEYVIKGTPDMTFRQAVIHSLPNTIQGIDSFKIIGNDGQDITNTPLTKYAGKARLLRFSG